jgi:soluble lytic murein transglycosylase-like protein
LNGATLVRADALGETMPDMSSHLRAVALTATFVAFGAAAFAQPLPPKRPRNLDRPRPVATVAPAEEAAQGPEDANVTQVPKAPATRYQRAPRDVAVAPAMGDVRAPRDVAVAPATGDVRALVSLFALRHGVPETLAHRIVIRESRYNPGARARAHFGLMQISLPTARQMGYTGAPQGLLDARTNLAYGMPYLANAWIVSGGSEAAATALYSRGYYYDAKRKGLIKALRNAHSAPLHGVDPEAVAIVQ